MNNRDQLRRDLVIHTTERLAKAMKDMVELFDNRIDAAVACLDTTFNLAGGIEVGLEFLSNTDLKTEPHLREDLQRAAAVVLYCRSVPKRAGSWTECFIEAAHIHRLLHKDDNPIIDRLVRLALTSKPKDQSNA